MNDVKGAPTISRAAAMLSCIALLAGCAAAPSRDDPFEPMNRAAYAVHEVVDGNIVKPIAQAYVDYAPRLVQKGISNFFGNIDDLFSFINGVLQNKPEKAGNDLGRVITNTGFGLARTDRHRVGGGHSERQRGLRPDVRLLGHSAGTVPVHPAARAHDGARRNRLDDPRLHDADRLHPRRADAQHPVGHRLPRCARARRCRRSRLVDQASLDRYTFLRRAYLQRRQYLVFDGAPPPPKDDDE